MYRYNSALPSQGGAWRWYVYVWGISSMVSSEVIQE